MILSNYTANLPIEQVDQMEESEINYGYTRKRNYTEVVSLGFCPTCNKRLTNLDDVYESENGHFCKESCEVEFIRQESESA